MALVKRKQKKLDTRSAKQAAQSKNTHTNQQYYVYAKTKKKPRILYHLPFPTTIIILLRCT